MDQPSIDVGLHRDLCRFQGDPDAFRNTSGILPKPLLSALEGGEIPWQVASVPADRKTGYRQKTEFGSLGLELLPAAMEPRYKYYPTKLGCRVLVTALVIREYYVQPTLVRNAL